MLVDRPGERRTAFLPDTLRRLSLKENFYGRYDNIGSLGTSTSDSCRLFNVYRCVYIYPKEGGRNGVRLPR